MTREQILDVAKRVLAARSGPISVKAVAAELGVAHNSISGRLRREKTTLERELAKQLLFDLSQPMLPGEAWQTYLRGLFQGALRECVSHPGLGRAVVPWISRDPTLCSDFTERILHVLGSAGVPASDWQSFHAAVLSIFCGMLSVGSPDPDSDAEIWATLTAVDVRRHPLLHRTQRQASGAAVRKASARAKTDTDLASAMAAFAIRSIEGKMA